jgi:hypothetical protein
MRKNDISSSNVLVSDNHVSSSITETKITAGYVKSSETSRPKAITSMRKNDISSSNVLVSDNHVSSSITETKITAGYVKSSETSRPKAITSMRKNDISSSNLLVSDNHVSSSIAGLSTLADSKSKAITSLGNNDISSSIVSVSDNHGSSSKTAGNIAENVSESTNPSLFTSIVVVPAPSLSSTTVKDNQNGTTKNTSDIGYIKDKAPLYPNLLPQASIYFARLKSSNGIAVTVLIGLGFCESYWLITLLISESIKIKSKMYQIASAAAILHAFNLVCYTIVLDYQISPYLLGDKQLGVWALICGVIGHLINILMYWFITIRLYMFMKVKF